MSKLYLWGYTDTFVTEIEKNWLIENKAFAALPERFHELDSDYTKAFFKRIDDKEKANRKIFKEAMLKAGFKFEKEVI